jgi:uncharacterized membrane protein YjjP (DUF1212 family)
MEAPLAPAPATREVLREILAIALQGGQLLLENGAETWRVEETIQRLGVGLGAEWMDIYPTPTGIIISTVAGDEHRTRIRPRCPASRPPGRSSSSCRATTPEAGPTRSLQP